MAKKEIDNEIKRECPENDTLNKFLIFKNLLNL